METWLLLNVPSVVLGLGMVFLGVAISIGGLLLVRRGVPRSTLEAQHEVAGFILAVIGVVYAVLLAFVVITVWQNYDNAKRNADQEAVSVQSTYRDALALHDVGPGFAPAVRAYAVSVADVEWPEMEIHHRDSPATNRRLNQVWHQLVIMRPRSEADSAFYADAITQLHSAAEARQIRILSSSDQLPTVLWVVLLLGGLITVAFTYFFGVANLAGQLLMVAGLAASISLVLFLILTLDLPFTGSTAVSPSSMQYAISNFAGDSVTEK